MKQSYSKNKLKNNIKNQTKKSEFLKHEESEEEPTPLDFKNKCRYPALDMSSNKKANNCNTNAKVVSSLGEKKNIPKIQSIEDDLNQEIQTPSLNNPNSNSEKKKCENRNCSSYNNNDINNVNEELEEEKPQHLNQHAKKPSITANNSNQNINPNNLNKNIPNIILREKEKIDVEKTVNNRIYPYNAGSALQSSNFSSFHNEIIYENSNRKKSAAYDKIQQNLKGNTNNIRDDNSNTNHIDRHEIFNNNSKNGVINNNQNIDITKSMKAKTLECSISQNPNSTQMQHNVSVKPKHNKSGNQYSKLADKIKDMEKSNNKINSYYPNTTNNTNRTEQMTNKFNLANSGSFRNVNSLSEKNLQSKDQEKEKQSDPNTVHKLQEDLDSNKDGSIKFPESDMKVQSPKSDRENNFTNANLNYDENAQLENVSNTQNDEYSQFEINQSIINKTKNILYTNKNQELNNTNTNNNYNDLTQNFLQHRKKNDSNNINDDELSKEPYEADTHQIDYQNNYYSNMHGNNNNNFSPNCNMENIVYKDDIVNNNNFSSKNNMQFNSNNVTHSNINNTHNNQFTNTNLRTQNSKALLTESKYSQYDTQELCYELVKEYAHLKIDKDEEFMRRMLFDIFKRQTKNERIEKLIEKNKIKIDENERIKAFNRLIEDANRRIEAQDQMEEMRYKLDHLNNNSKKYKFEDWEDIYQDRFLRFQKYKDQWLDQKQKEKQESEQKQEQEIIDSCKTIKKPKEEIEVFVQRMYLEAERRQIKKQNQINRKNNNEIDIGEFISKADFDKDIRTLSPTILKPVNKKKQQKYQFQSDMSESEDDNKFLNKIKQLKEKDLSNSPAIRCSPKKFNPNLGSNNNPDQNPIEEVINEHNIEESVMIYDDVKDNKNNHNQEFHRNIANTYTKKAWRKNYNSKNIPSNQKNDENKNINLTNNTDINNKRFEIEPSENKKIIVQNMNKNLQSNFSVNNSRGEGKTIFNKNLKTRSNDPINIYPENLKSLQEFEQRNFLNADEEDQIQQNPMPIKYNIHKRGLSKTSHNASSQNNFNKINQNVKYMPDHLASKLVDDILSLKLGNN